MARRGFAFDSGLAKLLVEAWAWGHKSACDVQPETEAEFNDRKKLSKTLKISVDFGSASLKQFAGFGARRDVARLGAAFAISACA